MAASKDTNNMNVAGGPKVNIKKVDFNTTGDSRKNAADASLDAIRNAPGPRGKTKQGA